MHADAIYNFFNNLVTGDSVKALDRYINDGDIDLESTECALKILLNKISSDQQMSTLDSWKDRIRDSNPKPAKDTRFLMYTALNAIRIEKNITEISNHTNATNDIIKSNLAMNATIIKVGGLVVFFLFFVCGASYLFDQRFSTR